MSKSLGNSPDPIDLIDKYGADGLRFGTMNSAPQGNDILFDETNVELGRNFCNKLWNAARFRQMQGPTNDNRSLNAILSRFDPKLADADDHAILGRLIETLNHLARDFSNYEFNTATQNLYAFFWGDFCDWYLEVAKARGGDTYMQKHVQAVQDICLREFLLLLHPFMPFITEELWHGLGFGDGRSFIEGAGAGTGAQLLSALTNVGFKLDASAAVEIANLREFVSQARALKAQFNLAAKKDLQFALSSTPAQTRLLARHEEKLLRLSGASGIALLAANSEAPAGAAAVITSLGTLYLDVVGSVDKTAERGRLSKELEQLGKVIAGSEARLANEAFTSKAPTNVIEGARQQLAENQAKCKELRRLLAALG